MELLKAILFGIVEGITEWLPISSTGHMILLGEWLPMEVSADFWEMFEVVIQLGAILAVPILFFGKLNPFSGRKSASEKRGTWALWGKVLIAVIPSAVIGLLMDDWITEHFFHYAVVAVALVVYGALYLWMEKMRGERAVRVACVEDISCGDALLLGAFQVLAMIPGTSRSGSTILGGMLCGFSRTAAAEFSFFMAIPTMAGAGFLKVLKLFASGVTVTASEWMILGVGCLTAFLVSLAVIRYLMDFVKKHSFSAFGVYRILLGVAVLMYFWLGR